jgi:RNA polymerase sigma factor (sigma-70 family)
VSQLPVLDRSFDVRAALMESEASTDVAFPDAVAALYEARFPLLFRYLDRLTDDPDLAKDMAQETFVKLYRRGAMPDDPHAWLTAVATNLFRDDRRQRGRRSELVALHASDASSRRDPQTADTDLIVQETRARVRAALDRLPLRDRRLLLLRHEGYSYRELAHEVGIGEGSVGTLLVRATRAFRQALGADRPAGAASYASRGAHHASD